MLAVKFIIKKSLSGGQKWVDTINHSLVNRNPS